MKYTTVIFDMDGTILDTLVDMKESINHALAAEGFPPRTLDEVRRFVGNGNHKLAERAVPEGTPAETVEAVFRGFHAHYKVHCRDHSAPYAGILPLLECLKKAGIRIAVVSNKADYAVQELCDAYFKGLFDAKAGEKESVRRKPWPDGVLAVMDALHADPAHTVYIGDSEVDIETARNAGLPCISVDWGFRPKDFLLGHGAETIVESVEELEEQLRMQN